MLPKNQNDNDIKRFHKPSHSWRLEKDSGFNNLEHGLEKA